MATPNQCPQCGAELPGDAPQGLCPACLMKLGLESNTRADTVSASGRDGATVTTPTAGGFVAPEPEALSGQFGELEVLELLGQGGMGAVYKARQPGLDRLVALKILPSNAEQGPDFAERFTREARSLAKLNHPKIVAVYDFGQTGEGLYYFVMEYVEGTNLREVIQAGDLSPTDALAIVPQICDALQYAHEEGIVHRDIKPENILLDTKGRVKIADFGLAKLLDRPAAAHTLTQAGQVMGTPHYMAPEQMEKPLEVDHRADIFSLGVVFYEMLTGELPLGHIAPPSQKVEVDVRLDEIVLKSLARETERRYQHASDIKTDMEALYGTTRISGKMFGYEYRSTTTILGYPLVHIAWGFDPATGRQRIAKGVIAVGNIATGGLAIGGLAIGVVAIGGGAIGVLAFGGAALGLIFAFAGVAVGGIAFGGGAIGLIAIGGGACGYYAIGGGAWGAHVITSQAQSPEALAFFRKWLPWLVEHIEQLQGRPF